MKKNLLKAAIPFIMLGSPAWAASSIRSISRGRVKKAAVQSSLGQAQPELTQAEFENPFSGFGGVHNTYQVTSHEQSNVLDFLAEEGLLTASSEASSLVTGNKNRKEFLAQTACVAGATYNNQPLINISATNSRYHLTYRASSGTITSITVSLLKFNKAKEACITSPTTTSIPTLSQWGQYLLILLLGIVGFKSRLWRDLKS